MTFDEWLKSTGMILDDGLGLAIKSKFQEAYEAGYGEGLTKQIADQVKIEVEKVTHCQCGREMNSPKCPVCDNEE